MTTSLTPRGDASHEAQGRSAPAPGLRAPAAGMLPGMASMTRDDVAHVAHLARLGLTEAELTRLQGQLNHIMDQYAVLATLPTDDIPPTAQTIEVETILRDDVVTPSLDPQVVLSGAPERSGDYFVVPAIIGSTD